MRNRTAGAFYAIASICVAACVGCQAAGSSPDVAATVAVDIPEPLVFDLVRGLGAKRGELEFNTLLLQPLSHGDPLGTLVAPEVEYAILDDFALELELPFVDGDLEAVKAAAQWTFGAKPEIGFIHGTQFIAERFVDVDAWELPLLYLPAFRLSDTWSTLGMVGIQSLVGPDVKDDLAALANLTIFADVSERVVLWLEMDSILLSDAGWAVLLMPQLHLDVTRHLTLQLGAGVWYLDGQPAAAAMESLVPAGEGWFPHASLRVVFEF